MYSLISFGIPVSEFPLTKDGRLKRETHLEWIQARRAIESARAENSDFKAFVELPLAQDILLGRGFQIQNHAGNMRLRLRLEELYEKYEGLGKWQKRDLANEVIDEVKQRGGRFLKHENGIWTEVDGKIALKKVAAGFRTLRGLKLESHSSKVESSSLGVETSSPVPTQGAKRHRTSA